jgi:hypothetical protein
MAIPQHDSPVSEITFDTIRRYVLDGHRPGGFTYAFLSHEFETVMRKADHINSKQLVEMYEVLYNMAPSGCHGSEEAVSDWIDQGGVQKNYEQFEELFDGYEQEHHSSYSAISPDWEAAR